MGSIAEFVSRHGYLVVFFGVLLEQLGIPLPSTLILVSAGAMCGMGVLNPAVVLCLAFGAALFGDLAWYQIGRWKGFQVLGFLCRISIEPDSCVGGAKRLFFRHGAKSLLLAKFIPGFNTVAQPLAGAINMPMSRFLPFEGLGILLWSGISLGVGYVFRYRLEQIFNYAHQLGWWFTGGLILGIGVWLGWKFFNRYRAIRKLRIAKITPEELKGVMDAGHEVLVVDLRGALDYQSNPFSIPGAMVIASEELEERHTSLPRDKEIVLYCTCPNEATSARVALRLKRHGITKVRPLLGGLDAWNELGFPVDAIGQD